MMQDSLQKFISISIISVNIDIAFKNIDIHNIDQNIIMTRKGVFPKFLHQLFQNHVVYYIDITKKHFPEILT